MTYPRGLLLLLPTYLSCYLFLAAYTVGAAGLSFDYNFSLLVDRSKLVLLKNSSTASDWITLTDNTPNLTGQVIHPQAVRLWDDRTGKRFSFDTSFSFAIGGEQVYTRGDGLAFFIGPQSPSGGGGGYLGLFNDPDSTTSPQQTIAVEFDTCRNDQWDTLKKEDDTNVTDHIGIDINSIRSNKTTYLPDLSLYGTMSANISYDGDSKTLKVALRTQNGSEFHLNSFLDLKDEGHLSQDVYVGFSAATGPLYESHHLLTWSFRSTEPPKTKLWVILVSVAASIILAGSVFAFVCIMYKRRRRRRAGTVEIVLPVARKFSYSELVLATDDFALERKIGAGAFGEVYRGTLPARPAEPAREVAVKKLTGTPQANWKDYETEIKILGQLSHRNLVKLIGWCNEGDKLLLVYELMSNGSVHDHLHGNGKTLSWLQRYNIILGIASAIDYLHIRYDTKRYVLHRDIKPSNVMLDENFEAKLGDFGLVRQLSRQPSAGTSGIGTTVIGSLDYIDPTYIETGKLSPASDVYSFGVVLLEIATGKKPSVSRGIEGHKNTLVNAVRRYYDRDAILEMADERLRGEFEQWQMERAMLTGLLCVQMDQAERPSIKDAIDLLSKQEQYPLPQILE